MRDDIFFNENGQTILEVLIALSVAVVVVSAMGISILTALRNAESSKVRNNATRYAQEGMEYMRFLRDSDYSSFAALEEGTVYCFEKSATSLTEGIGNRCSTNIDEIFTRYISIEKDDSDCAPLPPAVNNSLQVTVTVEWMDSKCASSSDPNCHAVTLDSCLSDYKTVPTP